MEAVHFLPFRAPLSQTAVSIASQARIMMLGIGIGYVPTVTVGGQPFPAVGWTRLSIRFEFPFCGTQRDFVAWARSPNGTRRLVDEVITIQNLLIDHLKMEFPFSPNLRSVRHCGPADWPYISLTSGEDRLYERASASLRSDVAALPLSPQLASLRTGAPVPAVARGLLRACDLADCGYPTEALLLAVAIMDATVQRALASAMADNGLDNESSLTLLRNTTQRRFATYLDPVLKLVCGHSLKEDDRSLFGRILQINNTRNDAIHRGLEVARSDAQNACLNVFDVLEYLNRVVSAGVHLPPRPSFD